MEPLPNSEADCNPSVAPGYIKFVRSPESEELIRDPKAFALLASIAFRARWRSGLGVDDVQLGEALIGDFRRAGMTRGEYREATKRLCKYRLATFRTTNRGTLAKLASSKVFDLNAGPTQDNNNQRNNQRTASQQPASDQQTTNEQPLTKKERREKGKTKEGKTSGDRDVEAEEIFQAYPRHEDKAEGLKAIRKALVTFPAAFLLERTRAFAAVRVNDPGHPRYTPLPATWFNKQRFNDDPSVWTANGRKPNGSRNGQFPEDISRLRPMEIH
jgi:hypothetical protein